MCPGTKYAQSAELHVWGQLYTVQSLRPTIRGEQFSGKPHEGGWVLTLVTKWHVLATLHCPASPGTPTPVLWSSSGPGIRYRDRLFCVHSHSKSIKYPVSIVSYTLSVFITHCNKYFYGRTEARLTLSRVRGCSGYLRTWLSQWYRVAASSCWTHTPPPARPVNK